MKILKGTFRKDRVKVAEPRPPLRTPRCPAWLDGLAVDAWRELVPLLRRMRVLTTADRMALAMACSAISEYRTALGVLCKEGQTYRITTDSGSVIRPRPEVAIASDAFKRVRSMLIEFGLTPAARPRVNALDPDDNRDNPFDVVEGMLFGGRAARVERYFK